MGLLVGRAASLGFVLSCLDDLDFVVCLNVVSFSYVNVNKSHWLGTLKGVLSYLWFVVSPSRTN